MHTDIPLIDLYLTPWLGKIALALVIFVVGKWIVDHLSKVLLRVMKKSNLEDTLVKFLNHLCYGFLMIAVVLISVQTLGVNISSLLALLGAAGLAVGLALKDSLSNFAAGVMIIMFRPFKSGDFITTGVCSGVVDEIGIFCTMLNTPDNQRIIIPNSTIISGIIINATTLPTRRIDLVISISGDDNIVTARQTILAVLAKEARILPAPAPAIGVDKIGSASVDLFVRPWVHTPDYAIVRAELQEQLKLALAQVGILIPPRAGPIYVQLPAKG